MSSRAVRWALLFAAIGFCSVGAPPVWAEGSDPAALAAAVNDATATLQGGLKASEPEGTPISAKFEIDDGKLQLSVYNMKSDSFMEVVADPRTGAGYRSREDQGCRRSQGGDGAKSRDGKGKSALADRRRDRGQRQSGIPGGKHLPATARRQRNRRGDAVARNDVQEGNGEARLKAAGAVRAA